MFKWDEKKKFLKEEGKYLRGIGMVIGVYGNGVFGVYRDVVILIFKLNEDGMLILLIGVYDMGNGVVIM